ncbi:hypothetical protein L3X38_008143 [Prunus dulcis]|uniref:Uncharacterized protein n=1 Tax=Prunus dulcis TaxID=3755 RepID=A0AAD5F6U1_PRUDU|nr:hypothetical protein L3X38_008143 [Prunus dulcis]
MANNSYMNNMEALEAACSILKDGYQPVQGVESEPLTPKEGEGEDAPAPKECEGRRLRLLQKLGLRLRLGSSCEWVITKKTGRSSSESDLLAAAERESKMVNQLQVHRGASESELSELNRIMEQKEVALKPIKKANKIYRKELALAFLLLTASVRRLDLIGKQMS